MGIEYRDLTSSPRETSAAEDAMRNAGVAPWFRHEVEGAALRLAESKDGPSTAEVVDYFAEGQSPDRQIAELAGRARSGDPLAAALMDQIDAIVALRLAEATAGKELAEARRTDVESEVGEGTSLAQIEATNVAFEAQRLEAEWGIGKLGGTIAAQLPEDIYRLRGRRTAQEGGTLDKIRRAEERNTRAHALQDLTDSRRNLRAARWDAVKGKVAVAVAGVLVGVGVWGINSSHSRRGAAADMNSGSTQPTGQVQQTDQVPGLETSDDNGWVQVREVRNQDQGRSRGDVAGDNMRASLGDLGRQLGANPDGLGVGR